MPHTIHNKKKEVEGAYGGDSREVCEDRRSEA